ncbi:SigE family RNA polymerase sigma factor [Micromonospora sp. NPDC049523]|uniref:SigE family RNA polymerase sigma factor n=1 Tax=Micromonospora sp. NPDC049523 TaxID=3155921 RepID=UPI003412CE59
MREQDEEDFRQFVATRMDSLRGVAYLTCGDWHRAEDAVSNALTKLYTRWGRVSSPHSYAYRMVVRAAIDEVRRPWRRERSAGHTLVEQAESDRSDAVAERLRIQAALRRVPPGQRAVLVLRFFEQLSVEEVAEVIGRSPGTVKSQTARGLATLRSVLSAQDATFITEEGDGKNDTRSAPVVDHRAVGPAARVVHR